MGVHGSSWAFKATAQARWQHASKFSADALKPKVAGVVAESLTRVPRVERPRSLNAIGAVAMAHLLRGGHEIRELEIPRDLDDCGLEALSKALLAAAETDPDSRLQRLECSAFAVTGSEEDYSLVRKVGHPPVSPVGVSMLASVAWHLTSLDVSGCHVKAAGASAIGKLLGLSSRLKTLLCERCYVGDAGGANLAEGLFDNKSLTLLSVAANDIRGNGAWLLCTALCHNSGAQVSTLRLDENPIGKRGWDGVCHLIAASKGLHTLDLRACGLHRANSASRLARGLGAASASLTSLSLSGNTLTEKPPMELVRALREMSNLRTLELSSCSLKNSGMLTMVDTDGFGLFASHSLQTLHLADNDTEISHKLATEIAGAIRYNTVMQELTLGVNRFDASGAQELCAALVANSALTSIDVCTLAVLPDEERGCNACWEGLAAQKKGALAVHYFSYGSRSCACGRADECPAAMRFEALVNVGRRYTEEE